MTDCEPRVAQSSGLLNFVRPSRLGEFFLGSASTVTDGRVNHRSNFRVWNRSRARLVPQTGVNLGRGLVAAEVIGSESQSEAASSVPESELRSDRSCAAESESGSVCVSNVSV